MLKRLNSRPAEARIILILGIMSVVALFPFAVMRFLRTDYILAAIDLTGVLSSAAMVAYILKTGRTKGPGLLLSLLSVSGVTAILLLQGTSDVHFLYPVILWTYFLVTPNIALFIGVSALLVIAPVFAPQMTGFEFAKFIMSILGCILFAYTFALIRNRQRDELINLSTKDGLTGAGNRRALDEKILETIQAFARRRSNLSLVLIDLDNFKKVNDRYGHGTGDEILIRLTELVQERVRATDGFYRYGGDEFVILVNGADLATAMGLAESIRTKVEGDTLMQNSKVSLSIGVSQYVAGQDSSQWLNTADQALLKAKQQGKNAVLAAAH